MIKDLKLTNFRCFENNHFNFSDGINLITGNNGSGKSSLIESIYLCGRGRSFRCNYFSDLIHHKFSSSVVFLNLLDPYQSVNKLGCQIENSKLALKFNGSNVAKRSDLLDILPFQLITPVSHKIIDSGPIFRRKFIDWGLFHVEHQYRSIWSSFNRVLKQRNSALKEKRSDIKFWNQEYISLSNALDEYRIKYFSQLVGIYKDVQTHLLDHELVGIDYKPGWNRESGLEESLYKNLDRDLKFGFSHIGPHKADIKFLFKNSSRNSLSRGQQKMAVFALQISQCLHLAESCDLSPIIMIDDVTAELDKFYLSNLFHFLDGLNLQVIITAIDDSQLDTSLVTNMFHVEH